MATIDDVYKEVLEQAEKRGCERRYADNID